MTAARTSALDGCSPTCKLEPGFKCAQVSGVTSCSKTVCGDTKCTAVCGDGLKFPQEACDDGNTTANDGCSLTCTIEAGFTCTVVEQSPPATLDIPILYRDFSYDGTDPLIGPADSDF